MFASKSIMLGTFRGLVSAMQWLIVRLQLNAETKRRGRKPGAALVAGAPGRAGAGEVGLTYAAGHIQSWDFRSVFAFNKKND